MIRFQTVLKLCSTSNKTVFYPKAIASAKFFATSTGVADGSSSSGSSSDDEDKLKAKTKKTEARNKLNELLKQMIVDDAQSKLPPSNLKLNLAQPRNRRTNDMRGEAGTQTVKVEPVEKQIVSAVKDVADTLGGNVKKTESELLAKLLNNTKEDSAETGTGQSLSEIFKGMKIERNAPAQEEVSRSQQVRQILQMVRNQQRKEQPLKPNQRQARTVQRTPSVGRDTRAPEQVNLFGGQELGIFTNIKDWAIEPKLETWQRLQDRELCLAVTHPPANYFQQMILWTEQGKIWKFPIDNEQDMGKEKDVYFTEHVFLEKHLESWCPPKGPIRHFMELVCVGLSKNYWLTCEEKQAHIEWYKEYFMEKKRILTDTGALPAGFDFGEAKTKQLEG